MVLSKRERYMAMAVGAVFGLLMLDRVVISPLLNRLASVNAEIADQQQQLDRAERLIANRSRVERRWSEMVGNELKQNASEAESQVLHSVRDWAQDSELALSSVKPERSEKEKDFAKTSFRATGAGGMAQIARFLWRIQTAAIPVRITDLQITSRKEGTDDLSLQLGVSTIYLPTEPQKPTAREAQQQ